MRATCPRVADCKAQQPDGWYCPCRVRTLLAEYAEFLESGSQMRATHMGGIDRVQGTCPAYMAQEEQVCKRADIATALTWLCATYPAQGYAVALAYGFQVDGTSIAFIGRRDATGKLLTPPIGTVALLLNAKARSIMQAERQLPVAAGRLPRRDTVRELIERGIEALAYRLGWCPGLEG